MRWLIWATLLLGSAPLQKPTLHVIRLGARGGNRFEPAEVIAHPGDTLLFVNAGNGLHNVEFPEDSVSEEAARLLERAMPPEKMDRIAGPLLITAEDVYRFVVPLLSPGRYPFICRPHALTGMKGALIVR